MKNCCICGFELIPFAKRESIFDCNKCMIWYYQDEISGFNFEDGRYISTLSGVGWELTIFDDLNGSKQKLNIKIPTDLIDIYYKTSGIREYNNKIYEFLKAVCSNLEFI